MDHSHHEHTSSHHQEANEESLNKQAFKVTLHCLTGCAIGEVLGMVIGTALGWSNLATIALAIGLAFFFGYLLTATSALRRGLELKAALGLALASDTLSIGLMETVDNGFLWLYPGAMDNHLTSVSFWVLLAVALTIAYFACVPLNRYLLKRGKKHCH